jgi:hypothetical protein
VRRALVGSSGTQLGLLGGQLLSGPGQDLAVDDLGLPLTGGVRRTLNNRLRTGTDKGNLTV